MVSEMRKNIKIQSAMEYLMTYGWAILIIAVVLGVLFQLGVFSSSSFSVRAPPGACQVVRTSVATSLVGQCSGLLPQYVGIFNGQSGKVNLPAGQALLGANPTSGTFTLWASTSAYPIGTNTCCAGMSSLFELNKNIVNGYPDGNSIIAISISSNSGDYPGNTLLFWTLTGADWSGGSAISDVPSLNTWYFFALTFNSLNARAYVNGVQVASFAGSNGVILDSTPGKIGNWNNKPSAYFNGDIANVQVYNASMDANDIQALYLKGIGGAPANPNYLVGWWPLNGNANDYSGKNNNGVPTSLSYASQYGK
jgi:hypothetical protein